LNDKVAAHFMYLLLLKKSKIHIKILCAAATVEMHAHKRLKFVRVFRFILRLRNSLILKPRLMSLCRSRNMSVSKPPRQTRSCIKLGSLQEMGCLTRQQIRQHVSS